MSKTLETKKKILDLLKDRNMTVTELSQTLGLAAPTVAQHIAELQEMGAIEKIDNEHFKKLKFYKINQNPSFINSTIARLLLGIAVIVVLGAGIYLYSSRTSNGGTTLYLGNSIKVGNVTVELSSMMPSNGINLATFSVYNKGVLTNSTTYAPGSGGTVNSKGIQLTIAVQATHNDSAIVSIQNYTMATSTSTVNYTTTLYPPPFPN